MATTASQRNGRVLREVRRGPLNLPTRALPLGLRLLRQARCGPRTADPRVRTDRASASRTRSRRQPRARTTDRADAHPRLRARGPHRLPSGPSPTAHREVDAACSRWHAPRARSLDRPTDRCPLPVCPGRNQPARSARGAKHAPARHCRITPHGAKLCSKTSTSAPRRNDSSVAYSPAGPAPTTATRIPLLSNT